MASRIRKQTAHPEIPRRRSDPIANAKDFSMLSNREPDRRRTAVSLLFAHLGDDRH